MPSLTKPTNTPLMNNFSNIMKCKMHAYLAYGTLIDAELPATAAALATLVSGSCVPLGDLTKEPITYGWKRETEEVHAGTKRGPLKVYASVKSISITSTMISLLDEADMNDDLTLILIPFGQPASASVSATNPAKAVVIRGLSMVDNGEANGNNKYGALTMDFEADCDKIANNLLLLTITTTGS